ncbi:cytoskeleton-associated protein 2-like [Rhynchocyon petersi]
MVMFTIVMKSRFLDREFRKNPINHPGNPNGLSKLLKVTQQLSIRTRSWRTRGAALLIQEHCVQTNCQGGIMVGPVLGSAAAAAVEERKRKLQEYLAAKGKLKSQNTKSTQTTLGMSVQAWLELLDSASDTGKDFSTDGLREEPMIIFNPWELVCSVFSSSMPTASYRTVGPRNDVRSHVVVPANTTRPTGLKLQPRTTSTAGTQKPKVDPPKILSQRIISRCAASNQNYKLPNNGQQQPKIGPSTLREASRKPVMSLNRKEFTTTKKQVTDQTKAEGVDSVENNAHVENEPLDHFVKEVNKENLPHTLSNSERKPAPEFCTVSKVETNSHNAVNGKLASKQSLSKSLMNRTVLTDRVNKQFIGKTQIKSLPIKSQQLSRGADVTKVGEKCPKTVPCQFKNHSRTPALKKQVAKKQDIKVNKDKHERPNEPMIQSCFVHNQKVKPAQPQTCSSLLQGRINNRHPNIKQDQLSLQPSFRPWTSYVLQNSKVMSQRPCMTAVSCNPVIPSTPNVRANGTSRNKYNFETKAQTLDSKLKKTLSQNQFLAKTAPKTQSVHTTMSRKGIPNEIQTNPDVKKKVTEDRRKQLEEWQKSKGKIYKRPPMELKAKRKVIEKMNVSFWKSIEKEEEEKNAQLELSSKINNTLTECLQLIEEGVFSNEVFDILSSIPEAEKFAKFWICKAKLLAHKGTFDVIGLYEEAIRNGAAPILELREVILNILQDSNRKTEGTMSASSTAEELIRKVELEESSLSPKEREQVTTIPQLTKEGQSNHPGIKLQIAPVPQLIGMPEVHDMKLITPVRRSARIERSVSRYPDMLQEHDLVVASLDELLEVEETECFIFRRNEALPVTLGFQILES